MQNKNNNEKRKSPAGKLIVKSAAWTLIALALVAIGYFGASFLFGGFLV